MNSQPPRLESWKEIGAYLQRDATTARRWEKEEGLPVHRHTHKSRSSVYAYPSEIDAWRASRKVVPETTPPRPLWKIPAFALTMLLCLIMVGNGVRPVSAQQARQAAPQVWTPSNGGADLAENTPSPDGRFLGFTDWQTGGDLVIHDFVTGMDRRLTDTGRDKAGDYADGSAISSDNGQVAYHWFDSKSKRHELRVLPLNGQPAQPRIILESEETEYIMPVGWTPDGREVVILESRRDHTYQFTAVTIGDGAVRVLKSFKWGPNASLSPDGRYLAYDLPLGEGGWIRRDIFVLALDGSREAVAVQHPADDFRPVWSPDGSQLLFLSDRTGEQALWRAPMQGGQPKGPAELVKAGFSGRALGLTREGVLYYLTGGVGSDIQVAELASGQVVGRTALATQRFLSRNAHPAWSPDGQSLIYVSYRGASPSSPESTRLVLQSLKTGEERDISPKMHIAWGSYAAQVRWFPDSRSVLVVAPDVQRRVSYYRVTLANGDAKLLHQTRRFGNGPDGPDVSPDGKSMFYVEGDASDSPDTRLMKFDLASRKVTELRRAPTGLGFGPPAISPDGADLAYMVYSANASTVPFIEVLPARGGEARVVARVEHLGKYGLAWTPDRHYLLFSDAADFNQTLWRVAAAGGEPEKTGISVHGIINSIRVRPDGRQVVFGVLERSPVEVWALENFLPAAR
jgi:Tol biopolymer transport system component